MIIFQNLIKNCHVTTEGVNREKRMFGPDISMLKGRSTCPKYVQVIDYLIDIPK